MTETVDWYRKFGTSWWGGVDGALTGPAHETTDKTASDGTAPAPLANGLYSLAGKVAA